MAHAWPFRLTYCQFDRSSCYCTAHRVQLDDYNFFFVIFQMNAVRWMLLLVCRVLWKYEDFHVTLCATSIQPSIINLETWQRFVRKKYFLIKANDAGHQKIIIRSFSERILSIFVGVVASCQGEIRGNFVRFKCFVSIGFLNQFQLSSEGLQHNIAKW